MIGGLSRQRNNFYDPGIGDIVFVDDDEIMGFARVVSINGADATAGSSSMCWQ